MAEKKVPIVWLPDLGAMPGDFPISPGVVGALREALISRARAKADKDDAESRMKSADGVLVPLLLAAGTKRVGVTGVGYVTQAEGTNSRISPDLLSAKLLSLGFSADVVKEVIDASTARVHYTYIDFRRPKAENGEE